MHAAAPVPVLTGELRGLIPGVLLGLLPGLALASALLAAASPADATSRAAAPTYAKDVAPILVAHCALCHGDPGAAAGLPLLSYDAAARKAPQIREQVLGRQMPPWPADAAHSLPFRNDLRLAQRDIDTIVAWVDAGAPRGNDADLPPAPAPTQGWQQPEGRAPDAIVSLPQITVAANGTVPYIQKLIKVPYTQDRWISALQVRAGNPRLLHHLGITEVALPQGVTPEQMAQMDAVARQIGAPSGGVQIQRAVVADPVNPGAYDMLGVYAPGTLFESYGDGNGKLLRGGPNVYINFNIHYTTTGKVETDRSQLALWFAASPPAHVLFRAPSAVDAIIANGRELLHDDPGTKAEGTGYALPPIPANSGKYELIGMTAYRSPVTLYQLQPHAHVRAVDFHYAVIYPDGREQSILDVPHYSYHFQLAYQLATPLQLPAGSKLVVTAHYDNSLHNGHLRELGTNESERKCGPENVAYFGLQNQSWDEMFSPLVQYSVDRTPAKPLPLVRTVGCLLHDPAAGHDPSSGWKLAQASAADPTDEQGTSSEELRAAARKGPGSADYRLLGVAMFDPDALGGKRVAVKGVLIAGAPAALNVTSLQPIAASCHP